MGFSSKIKYIEHILRKKCIPEKVGAPSHCFSGSIVEPVLWNLDDENELSCANICMKEYGTSIAQPTIIIEGRNVSPS